MDLPIVPLECGVWESLHLLLSWFLCNKGEIALPLQTRLWSTLQENGIRKLTRLGTVLARNQKAEWNCWKVTMQLQNLINMVCCLQRGFNFLRYSHCLIGQFWPLTRFSYIFVSPVVVPEIFTSLELGCCNNQLIRATYCHISDSMVNFIMELGMDTINFPHFE